MLLGGLYRNLKCHCFCMQARHYYQIIKRPMDLSVIRAKLNKRNTQSYKSPDEFVADVYLMFRNCAKFNYVS